jgi:hypothetical protein
MTTPPTGPGLDAERLATAALLAAVPVAALPTGHPATVERVARFEAAVRDLLMTYPPEVRGPLAFDALLLAAAHGAVFAAMAGALPEYGGLLEVAAGTFAQMNDGDAP